MFFLYPMLCIKGPVLYCTIKVINVLVWTGFLECLLFTLRSAAELLTLSCGRRCVDQPPLRAHITSHMKVDTSPLLKYTERDAVFDNQSASETLSLKKRLLTCLKVLEKVGKRCLHQQIMCIFSKSIHISLETKNLRFKDYISNSYWLYLSVQMKVPPKAPKYLLCWMIKLL